MVKLSQPLIQLLGRKYAMLLLEMWYEARSCV
jgi:hypothetical protein